MDILDILVYQSVFLNGVFKLSVTCGPLCSPLAVSKTPRIHNTKTHSDYTYSSFTLLT